LAPIMLDKWVGELPDCQTALWVPARDYMQKNNDIYTIEVTFRNKEGGMDTCIGSPLTDFIWCDGKDLSLKNIRHISVPSPGFFEWFYKKAKNYQITLHSGCKLESKNVTGNIIMQVAGMDKEVTIDTADLFILTRLYF